MRTGRRTKGPGKWFRVALVGGCVFGTALLAPRSLVRAAEPAPAPSAAPSVPPPADAGVTDPPTSAPLPAPSPDAADAGAAPPSATPAPDDAPVQSTEEASAAAGSESSGGGLFESSQSDGASSDDASEDSAPLLNLGGSVRGDLWVGKVVGRPRGEMKAAFGELGFEVRTKKETFGDAFADLRLRYGLQGEETDMAVALREAYVNLYAGPLDLRLGQQIVVWGRADAFNPTNNITPFDLRIRSPVEDDRRLGNVGARAFLNFSPFRLEGVWMPLYRPAEIPIILPDYARFTDPNFPTPKLKNGLFAGRLHLELASFEASASFLHGFAPLPGLALHSVDRVTPPISVTRTAYRHHVVGADFSTAFGDVLGLRGEAAYRHPVKYEERYYAPNPDLQYALGVDRSFGAVNVIVQYLGRTTFNWEKKVPDALPPGTSLDPWDIVDLNDFDWANAGPQITSYIESEIVVRNQMLFSQLHRVQHILTARLEWLALHDTLTTTALGMVNFSTEEFLIFPKVSYRFSDAVSATVGGEVYAGPTGTLFGTIDAELSAGYAELRYDF